MPLSSLSKKRNIKMKSSEDKPSLDPAFTNLMRSSLDYMPLEALRISGNAARTGMRAGLQKSTDFKFKRREIQYTRHGEHTESKIAVESLTFTALYHREWRTTTTIAKSSSTKQSPKIDANFLYLHGGAFSLCDSGDYFLAKRLLPSLYRQICHQLDVELAEATHEDSNEVDISVTMHTPLYSLHRTSHKHIGTLPIVSQEVLVAYDSINSHLIEKGMHPVCAVLGDSAGGNLALNLNFQLQSRNEKRRPSLVLISPWLKGVPNCLNEYRSLIEGVKEMSNGPYIDILNVRWLRESLINYFGSNKEQEKKETPYVSCVLLCTDDQLAKLPPTLMIGGGRELFYDEISAFKERVDRAKKSHAEVDVNIKIEEGNVSSSAKKSKVRFEDDASEMELLIADNDIHAYPLFWMHPVRVVLDILSLAWMFDSLFPPQGYAYANGKRYSASDGSNTTGLIAINSESGDNAVRVTARFVAKAFDTMCKDEYADKNRSIYV